MEETLRIVGPYHLIRKLGSGAYGVVWLAKKPTAIATTRVALKLPHNRSIDLEAFRQEAAIWIHAGGHANVLPLIDADIYDEQAVLVSEYAPDGSLLKWLNEHEGRAPSIDAACEMIDGVLAGLSHLHARRIIHRDLKPDNILLQGDTPRLTDFGFSRLLLSNSQSMSLGGTPVYMAPEAFRFKRDEQTDIWSVGVVFYQLLAGHLPYDQREYDLLVEAVTQQDAPPLPAAVPEVLRKVVMKALQRDPTNRYATATLMRQDLREAKHKLWFGEQKTYKNLVEPPAPTPEPPSPPPQPRPIEPQPQSIDSQPQPGNPQPQPIKPQPSPIESQPPPIEPPPPAPVIPPEPDVPTRPVVPARGKLRRWLPAAAMIGGLCLAIVLAIGIKLKYFKDEPTPTLTNYSKEVNSLAYSPDGKTLASGSDDATVKLWDARSGALQQTLNGHKSYVLSVAFSPDGKMLASAGLDKVIKVWDMPAGTLRYALTGHQGVVNAVAFSPDSRLLASGSSDNTVKLWDAQTGALKQTFSGHTDTVRAVAFSFDNKTLASGSRDRTIRFWDITTNTAKKPGLTFADPLSAIAFSRDGKTLAVGGGGTTVTLWDALTGKFKLSLSGHTDSVSAVLFSPDSRLLASGSSDDTVKLWDAQTGKLKQTFTGHNSAVQSVAFSPDGKTLASASVANTVKLWPIE